MRTMNPVHESTSCAVAACAAIIGAKWTALLVHDLSEGPRRFSQLEHSCAGISPRTLSERLRALFELPLTKRGCLVVSADTLMQRLPPRAYVQARAFELKVGEKHCFRKRLRT